MAFPLVKKSKGTDFKMPEPGIYTAVCAAIEYLGEVEIEYKGEKKVKEQICVVFELDEKDDDGNPLRLRNWYNFTNHEKGTLRDHILKWTLKDISKINPEQMPMDKLVGLNLQIVVQEYQKKNGDKGVKIDTVMPPKDKKWYDLKASGLYVKPDDIPEEHVLIATPEPPQEKQEPQTKTVQPDVEFNTPPDTEDAPF